MKRLCTSDWQLADGARDRYRLSFVANELPKLIEKYKPDQLLVLGDITEAKDAHPAPLVNEIVDIFYNLSQQCEVIILQGNHDFLHKEHPYFQFVSNFKNVHWVATSVIKENCLWLPHTRDYKSDWAGINLKDDYDFVFAHNIFTGVNAANGHALAGIPPTIFGSNTVISGDVHEPQIVNGNVIYVGSPFTTDFGDDFQGRVLLLDDLKIKSIKVYGQQKRLVNWDWGKNPTHNANENDIVKINVHIQMEDVANWATIRQEVENWAAKNKFVLGGGVIPNVAYVKGERQKVVKSIRKTDHQYLDQFTKRSGIDERTAAVGQEIVDL